MKRLRLGGVALVALIFAGRAFAASAPVYDWTGFYVGLNAGGAWGREDETLALTGNWVGRPEVPGLLAAGSQGMNPSGFTGGGQIGFNWQAGPAVFGIEADFNLLNLHNSRFIANVPNASKDTFSYAATSENNWMTTVRGRIGYAYDHWLLYATGGVAVIDDKFSQTLTQTDFPFVEAGAASATKAVGIVGGGIEYALGNRWSVKGEYLHADLGGLSFNSAGVCPSPNTAVCLQYTGIHTDKLRIDIVRAGINYKFDWRH